MGFYETIFLSGSIIKAVEIESIYNIGDIYAFEISQLNLCIDIHYPHEKRILYCKTKETRDEWIRKLQKSSYIKSFNDEYILGKEIGIGAFSK